MASQALRRTIGVVFGLSVLATSLGAQGSDAKPDSKAALDKLKSLKGTWTGTIGTPEGPPAVIRYEVRSNGTAVMETLFPDSDHEMVTVYHLDRSDLVATHYCASGNQPHFRLEKEKATATELSFGFTGGTNLDPATDAHIHSGRIRFVDEGRFEAEWDFYQAGKLAGGHRFLMSRKK